MSDYDKSIHHNPDAKAWAKFFMESICGKVIDEELMLGWFANAMMAMHDHIHNNRTWVGLTDEEWIKALELCDFDKVAAFEFFEAKLKEKNT